MIKAITTVNIALLIACAVIIALALPDLRAFTESKPGVPGSCACLCFEETYTK